MSNQTLYPTTNNPIEAGGSLGTPDTTRPIASPTVTGGELIFNKPPQPLSPEEEGLAAARRKIAGEIPNSPTLSEQLSNFQASLFI